MNTRIPIPPTQIVIERQSKILFGIISIFLITEDPVVVKPDAVSKNASKKLGKTSLKMSGKDPKAEKINHESPTTAKPSFGVNDNSLGFRRDKAMETMIKIPIGIKYE